jgi:hypothetical protein
MEKGYCVGALRFRYSAVVGLALSTLSLSACSPAPQSRQIVGTQVGPPPGYTLNTPVERIAADPAGRAVLNQDLPGLITNPNDIMIEEMSLAQIASISNGRLSRSLLDKVQADLTRLTPQS